MMRWAAVGREPMWPALLRGSVYAACWHTGRLAVSDMGVLVRGKELGSVLGLDGASSFTSAYENETDNRHS